MAPPRSPLVDQSGRVLGPRARGTRLRLLDATAELLEKVKVRDLRVVDIARAVETSPATFYQYFKDVEEVVLRLAEQASDEMPAVVEEIEGSWRDAQGLARARRIVDAFIRHWDRHQAVLRVRNLASDEGDRRFRAVRRKALSPVIEALARQIEAAREAGRVRGEIHPHAAAAAMAAILERLAAYHQELGAFGVTRDQLVETSAHILHRTVTGRD
ncbi:MAG: TetR family transcriptional regulator [Proteobacteria bacterium]|nr:TetR family transcriptional regulator [Pseudomonadota bacterium]